MGAARRVLADGEEVVYQARPHWMALGWPLVWVVVLPIALAALVVTVPATPLRVAEAMGAVTGLMALWLCGRIVRWLSSSLTVSTLRVIERAGVLSRRVTEIRLERIAELSTHQSLLALALGGGQLVVETGAADPAILDHVRRPARVQSIVTEQIATRHRSSPSGASGGWYGPATPREDGRGFSEGQAGWGGQYGSEGQAGWGGQYGSEGQAGRGGQPGRDGQWGWGERRAWGGVRDMATPPAGTAAVGAGGTPELFGGPPPGASVAERLATLAELHRRGLVDDAELTAKRAEILRQL
ncbi:MAG: PH domain-containing protein [Actinomycetota bacterium]|nr:PH domain-containing protein [Actinomycetota bacterium]